MPGNEATNLGYIGKVVDRQTQQYSALTQEECIKRGALKSISKTLHGVITHQSTIMMSYPFKCDVMQHSAMLADLDECVLGVAECSPHAECENSAGSYDCHCRPGFEGDGKTCTGQNLLCIP